MKPQGSITVEEMTRRRDQWRARCELLQEENNRLKAALQTLEWQAKKADNMSERWHDTYETIAGQLRVTQQKVHSTGVELVLARNEILRLRKLVDERRLV